MPDSSDSRTALTEGVWWFDANSSRRQRASLHFADGSIRAENETGGRRDARLTEVEISSRIGVTPRKIMFADGVCIAADDNDFIDAMILKHGGGRKSFALHRLESKTATVIMIVIGVGLFLSVLLFRGIPAAAEFGAERVPREHIEKIGGEVYMQLQQRKFIHASKLSPADTTRAQDIFARVVAALAQEEEDFRLHLHNFSINAFALPGGRVVVSDALVELLNDDELAAVFAHEIGHIRYRHGVRNVLLSSAGGLLAVLSGDISGISLGTILLNLGYSRDYEREADCFAYGYLRRNDIPVSLIGEALEKMENSAFSEEPETSAHPETDEDKDGILRRMLIVLSSHPETAERKDLDAVCDVS